MKKTISFFLVLLLCGMLLQPVSAASSSDSGVLAHWKFQNEEGYYTGNIDTDDLVFLDLSGNGNNLVVRSEGNGDQLDIFTWDTGVDVTDLTSTDAATSLKFNNTLAQAKSVDPYDPSQNTFSGAYVSGKYLETVENAPLNGLTGHSGWTIEIIFKVSAEWNATYNRYTGIFSRQGVVDSQNEPPLSLALAGLNSDGNADGSLGDKGATGLQYVHVDPNEKKTNVEFMNEVYAEQWIHYMVTSNGIKTSLYCNGKLIRTVDEGSKVASKDASYGWDVGVGRKLIDDSATSMSPNSPEGMIRRLFCGSISEIRVSEGEISLKHSLLNPVKQENVTTEAITSAPETNAPTAVTDPQTTATVANTTGCGASVAAACLPMLCCVAAMLLTDKKKKRM